MSKLEVDAIEPQSGTTLTIGASGDTTNIIGTLQNDGSAVTSYTDSDALSLFNASGSAPVYAARAWVNFNGSGTVAINGSENISSVSDTAVGRYTVNFTTAMQDDDYSATACAFAASTTTREQTASSINLQIRSSNFAGFDATSINLTIHR